MYSHYIFNKVILLKPYYLITKDKFVTFNQNIKINYSIKLYKYRFFKKYNTKIT